VTNSRAPIAAVFLALLSGAGPAAAFDPSFQPIDLTVERLTNFRLGSSETKFGTLEFRGGLQLSSTDKRFGSLSGLDVGPDGTLTAVADTGYWFTARLIEADDKPIDLEAPRLASILDQHGNKLLGKGTFDAEGLRIVRRNGKAAHALVSFERANVVRRYVPSPDFAHAAAVPVKVPLAITRVSRNEGLEAIAVAPQAGALGGAMVLIAEHALDGTGNHRAWIVGGPRAGAFTIRRTDDFDVTDADFLPSGDLVVLERRASLRSGVAMRIRRIAVGGIRPGAAVDGPIQIEANLLYQIDNMEGLSVRPGPGGEALIAVISDDNQNHMLQRTVLVEFALPADAPAPVAASAPTTPAAPVADEGRAAAPTSAALIPPIPRPRPQIAR
jgi:hypothetical protein